MQLKPYIYFIKYGLFTWKGMYVTYVSHLVFLYCSRLFETWGKHPSSHKQLIKMFRNRLTQIWWTAGCKVSHWTWWQNISLHVAGCSLTSDTGSSRLSTWIGSSESGWQGCCLVSLEFWYPSVGLCVKYATLSQVWLLLHKKGGAAFRFQPKLQCVTSFLSLAT